MTDILIISACIRPYTGWSSVTLTACTAVHTILSTARAVANAEAGLDR